MTRPIIIQSPPSSLSLDKRQPLLSSQDSSPSSHGGGSSGRVVRKARLAEVAGGTTAECAAVACCCPCGIANLLVLAVYKVPTRPFPSLFRNRGVQAGFYAPRLISRYICYLSLAIHIM